MLSLQEFINTYNGVPNVGDNDQNRGQCVGLIEVWVDNLGLTHVWGNAKDLLNGASLNSFDIIYNSPTNFPLPGDIFVCGATWGGGDGHTGIIVSADVNTWTAFEQNNPTGHAPQILSHNNYNGMLGWLHPKLQVAPTPAPTPTATPPTWTDQTKIPLGPPWGDMELQAVRSTLGDQKRLLDTTQAELAQAQKDLAQAQAATPTTVPTTTTPPEPVPTDPGTVLPPTQPSTPAAPDSPLIAFLKRIFGR